MSDIDRWRGLLSDRPHHLRRLDEHVTFTRVARGQMLVRPVNSPELWHLVVAGIVMRSVFHPEGRRQIVDLLLPGDFCCDLTAHDETECLEAIADETVVANYPFERIESAAESDSHILREICSITFDSLARREEHLLILGRTTVLEKLYAFLVNMQTRIPTRPDHGLKLPLSRSDIADYLGVSVETISRCFSELKDRHLIALSGTRMITIMDGLGSRSSPQAERVIGRAGQKACAEAGFNTNGPTGWPRQSTLAIADSQNFTDAWNRT